MNKKIKMSNINQCPDIIIVIITTDFYQTLRKGFT